MVLIAHSFLVVKNNKSVHSFKKKKTIIKQPQFAVNSNNNRNDYNDSGMLGKLM